MLIKICTRAIEFLFYALFFFVPLIFLPVNFELFEFNKMILTYAITVLIAGFWAIKMVLQGEIRIQKTPLDIPILLFLASQIISTIVSIDIHTSLWGYYSRSNGGLASIISYIVLYYAFVSNFPQEKLRRLLLIALASGTLVAIYGVLERFGIDKDYWVQDVQNRVFSTLGQPNWLAAYLSVLIPISIVFGLSNFTMQTTTNDKVQNAKLKMQNFSAKFKIFNFKLQLFTFYFTLLTCLFYLTLLFTKSRSGFLGLWTGLMFFLASYFWLERKNWWKILSVKGFILKYWYVLVVLVCIGSITFLVGSPFEQLNKFTLEGLRSQLRTSDFALQTSHQKPQGPALETGGTESGEIRKIVWKGAIDIAKAYPLFGSGVETFAYSYYRFRPIEHNRTSEWDFLYNKAHNEYLNYLANTGFVGLGAYLLMIGWFVFTAINQLKTQMSHSILSVQAKVKTTTQNELSFALLAGYISILVSNFFGFSVVIINLFFFLIPAFVFVLAGMIDTKAIYTFSMRSETTKNVSSITYHVSRKQLTLILFIILTTCYSLLYVFRMWDADRNFATGKNFDRSGEYSSAYHFLVSAIKSRPDEPIFREELSVNTSDLALAALDQKEATLSAELTKEATRQSDYTITTSPNNPNFWRTRVRVFYTLNEIDDAYTEDALFAARKAAVLSPTDPTISYNLGLLMGQTGRLDEAIEELEKTIKLKPDYRDPIYALGLFYFEKATDAKGKVVNRDYLNKAIAQMEAVLKLASQDAEAIEKLKQWRGF